jgi:hypothetical protein
LSETDGDKRDWSTGFWSAGPTAQARASAIKKGRLRVVCFAAPVIVFLMSAVWVLGPHAASSTPPSTEDTVSQGSQANIPSEYGAGMTGSYGFGSETTGSYGYGSETTGSYGYGSATTGSYGYGSETTGSYGYGAGSLAPGNGSTGCGSTSLGTLNCYGSGGSSTSCGSTGLGGYNCYNSGGSSTSCGYTSLGTLNCNGSGYGSSP